MIHTAKGRGSSGLLGCRRAIETLPSPAMPARSLLHILTLIALFMAPLGMTGGHAAMAMPANQADGGRHMAMPDGADHCPSADDESRDRSASIDCMIACSGMLPLMPVVESIRAVVAAPDLPTFATAEPGLDPAAEPPPPRYS